MSLINNIENLQSKLYGKNFDISDKYLSDDIILKNLIKKKNPELNNVQVDEMVDGPKQETNGNVAQDNLRKQTDKKEIFRGEVTTQITNAFFPLPIDNEYYQEVSRIKNEVRDCVLFVMKEKTELIQYLIVAAIKIATTISAIVTLIMAPPFNVPAALTLAVIVIETLLALCGRIENILPHLEKMKQIDLLIDPVMFDTITAPINTSVIIINGIITPLQILCGFANKVKEKLEEETTETRIYANCRKIAREIRRKQKELRELQAIEEPSLTDLDEIEGLVEEIVYMRSRCSEFPDLVSVDVSAFSNVINRIPTIDPVDRLIGIDFTQEDLRRTTITDELYETLTNTQKLAEDIIYVYDVKLPDGSMVRDLNETQLGELKQRYDLVFKTNI